MSGVYAPGIHAVRFAVTTSGPGRSPLRKSTNARSLRRQGDDRGEPASLTDPASPANKSRQLSAPEAAPQLLPYDDRWQPGIVDVIKSVYDEYRLTWDPDKYHRDLFTVRETYIDTGGFFSVLVLRGGVIGTVSGLDRGGEAEIERLYLAKEHRGRGYGRLMTEHFLDWARSTGHRNVIAWSDKRFDDAHRMYERMGFSLIGDRILDDPDESPEWGFELRLDPVQEAFQ